MASGTRDAHCHGRFQKMAYLAFKVQSMAPTYRFLNLATIPFPKDYYYHSSRDIPLLLRLWWIVLKKMMFSLDFHEVPMIRES
jgi:hypothetical protein